MVATRVAGHDFSLEADLVERLMAGVEPEQIRDHYAVVSGRRFPPKQVLATATGLDRADFTTHQARSILRRLGFGVFRRSVPAEQPAPDPSRGPHGGAEADLLGRYAGRWVAQQGLEVVFDAASPEDVVRWLRRHDQRARVWRVPDSPAAAGSSLSTP